MSSKKKIEDERLKIEMQEISNRINEEMCEIFDRLGNEEKQYELVAGATVLSLGWLMASLVEEEKAYGVDPDAIMLSFVGILTGHSHVAAQSLFDVLKSHESLLRSVIDLIRTTDEPKKKTDDGGTLH